MSYLIIFAFITSFSFSSSITNFKPSLSILGCFTSVLYFSSFLTPPLHSFFDLTQKCPSWVYLTLSVCYSPSIFSFIPPIIFIFFISSPRFFLLHQHFLHLSNLLKYVKISFALFISCLNIHSSTILRFQIILLSFLIILLLISQRLPFFPPAMSSLVLLCSHH